MSRELQTGTGSGKNGDVAKMRKHAKIEQAAGQHFEPFAIEVAAHGSLSEVAGKLVTRLIHRVRDRRNRNAAFYPLCFYDESIAGLHRPSLDYMRI